MKFVPAPVNKAKRLAKSTVGYFKAYGKNLEKIKAQKAKKTKRIKKLRRKEAKKAEEAEKAKWAEKTQMDKRARG